MKGYIKYKIPTIVRGKDRWFIKYFFENPSTPGKFKEFRVKDGINRVKDFVEREKYAEQLRSDIEYALVHLDYNPFLEYDSNVQKLCNIRKEIKSKAESKLWTVKTACEKYLNYCAFKNLKKNSLSGYNSLINIIREYFTDEKIISTISDIDVENFLHKYSDEKGWKSRTYNNHVINVRTFFKTVSRLEKKENKNVWNIDLSDLELKISRAEKNKYYHSELADIIKIELNKHPYLDLFVRWIFYSCMRPAEIMRLRIVNIDLVNKQIKIGGEDGKTGDRLVPICEELYNIILDMNLDKYPSNYYVFSDKGNPKEKQSYEDYFSKRYRWHIKSKLNLDQNYTLYGWKHTRVVNLIYAGFSDNEIMTLTGHRDKASFEKYKRELVLDPNNKMTGKTISF